MTQSNQTLATTSSIEKFSFFNAEQFETMKKVAVMFSSSELVPDMYQIAKVGKEKAVSNTIIAIDIANRIEANILMVMQNLVIIYGRPSWSSKFLISTVNTCGRFAPLKFKITKAGVIKNYKYTEYETSYNQGKKQTKLVEKTFAGPIDDLQCVAYTSIKGSDELLESAPISIKMAIDEGWYTKKGSKWKTMPQQMLMYRSASFWTNAYAPELSMGMKTVEEVSDTVDIDYEEVKDKKEETKANSQEIDMDKTPEQDEKHEPEKEPEESPMQPEQPKQQEKPKAQTQFPDDLPFDN